MKSNYQNPQCEVIETKVQAVLCESETHTGTTETFDNLQELTW